MCLHPVLSVQFSLQPHGWKHARLPCLLPTPRVYSNSRPLSQWCHPTISSSAVPFSSPPSIFPSMRVFFYESALHIRWPNIRASASASVLPMNIQGWFPLGWTGWIALKSKELSGVFSSTIDQKHQFFSTQLSLWRVLHQVGSTTWC